jgi:protein ImuB
MERWTPSVSLDPPDGLTLDATGLAHLFGGEALYLASIREKLMALGITARLAMAGNATAARALARHAPAASLATIVPPGKERAALAALPVAALPLTAATVETLNRLGLKRIGDLYPIPAAALARRFRTKPGAGEVGAALDRALGIEDTPLCPYAPPPRFSVRHAVVEPLVSPEGLAAMTGELAAALCRLLAAQAQGALRLVLKLYRVDGSRLVLPIGLAAPSRDQRHLERLIAPRLESLDMGFGIDAGSLDATETGPLDLRQTSLTDDPARDPAALARFADRLANRPEDAAAMAALIPAASHLPERAETAAPGFAEPPAPPPSAPGDAPPRPLLLLTPPEAVAVIASVPDGPPMRFTWRHRAHQVARADGPERIGPEWWRDGTPAPRGRTRDYYVVEDRDGRRYWLYREGLYDDPGGALPAWYIHGLFP